LCIPDILKLLKHFCNKAFTRNKSTKKIKNYNGKTIYSLKNILKHYWKKENCK